MMGAAQLERLPLAELDGPELMLPLDQASAGSAADQQEGTARSALRQTAADKLAAHRERRARLVPAASGQRLEAAETVRTPGKKDRIAAAVAERYAQTPSYRTFLAEEAQRATQQAAAAAEVAARNAEAVRAVQQELLAELELWTAPQEFSGGTAVVSVTEQPQESAPEPVRSAAHPAAPSARPHPTAGLTVGLYADAALAGSAQKLRQSAGQAASRTSAPAAGAVLSADEAQALHELDEEIAFRQAPFFEPYHFEPAVGLPANLLEFPRQLIAARKARPRLAEGPLTEDSPRSPQLRIFEVEPEQMATQPALPAAAPAWSNMRLDPQPVIAPEADAYQTYEALILAEQLAPSTPESLAAAPRTTLAPMPVLTAPQPAPFSLRLMAGLVDLALVLFSLLGAVAGCVKLNGGLPWSIEAGLWTMIPAGIAVLALYVCYYLLFFTLSDQTPGMRYARLGLCTFRDENPTRPAMRRRLMAQLVAMAPLGLGLLWVLIDEERLGWHDRISGMYLRSY